MSRTQHGKYIFYFLTVFLILILSQLSMLGENTTSNGEMLTKENITPLTSPPPTIFTNNQTDSATENGFTDARPIIINENNVDWIGIVGVFGSAIAGAFFGSYLQNLLTNRDIRKREHLTDLKNNVTKGLFNIVSRSDFPISAFNFRFVKEGNENKIISDNILFNDFMANHYPHIYVQLMKLLDAKMAMDNTEHDLKNNLELNLKVTSGKIEEKNQKDDYFNHDSIKILVRAILDNSYDDSYFRVTVYDNNTYLYFYHTKDDMIPFESPSDQKSPNLIFESISEDLKYSSTRVNEVREALIQNIRQTLKEREEEIQTYQNRKTKFYLERKILADKLLTVTYSTKLKFKKTDLVTRLKFKKSDPNEKCLLT